MKYISLIFVLLFFTSCTSSHRLAAIYESGDAVTGPVTILEKKAKEVKEDEEKKKDSSSSFSDSLGIDLP